MRVTLGKGTAYAGMTEYPIFIDGIHIGDWLWDARETSNTTASHIRLNAYGQAIGLGVPVTTRDILVGMNQLNRQVGDKLLPNPNEKSVQIDF